MSGIYIPDMEMPKFCLMCPCAGVEDLDAEKGEYWKCEVTGSEITKKEYTEQVLANCPLFPVPDHGRLIDADALDADLERQDMRTGEWDAIGFSIYEVDNAPTVIPAAGEYP